MNCTSFSHTDKKKIVTLLQEQDADANFPFYFTEAESQEEGQAWWLGVKGLDYEESRYYNFRIVLEVNSLQYVGHRTILCISTLFQTAFSKATP